MLRKLMGNHARALLLGSALAVSAAGIGVVAAQEATPEPQPPMAERAGHGFLGISIEDADDSGARVVEVLADSPAAVAELQAGDVITAVNGGAVTDARELRRAIRDFDAGAVVSLDVTRGEESLTFDVTLGENEMMFEFALPGNSDNGRGNNRDRDMRPFQMHIGGTGRLGLTFVTLDEQVAAERAVELTDGALVVAVIEGSPAAIAGLQADDVITAVNGEPVDAERTLRDRLIAYEPDDVISLTVTRAGETLTIDATLGQPEMMDGMPFFEGMMPGMRGGHGFRFEMPPMGEMMPEATVMPNA